MLMLFSHPEVANINDISFLPRSRYFMLWGVGIATPSLTSIYLCPHEAINNATIAG
jgi:hypothetical protein